MINEIKGDLFNEERNREENLAHCVSRCFTMGKGIAVEFKERFGRVDELKAQNKKIGEVAYLSFPSEGKQKQEQKQRYIFYLITKEKYYGKPTYDTLRDSLIDLKNLMLKLELKSVSMPKIGCGLDRLDWDIVKNIILQIFKDTGITINVYYL